MSEPLLSLAMATLLCSNGTQACDQRCQCWSDIIDFLSKAYQLVGLMLGKEGEECVHILCSLAANLTTASQVSMTATSARSDFD